MFHDRNHFEMSEKKAKLCDGPTSPKPGPMFIRADTMALIAEKKSMSSARVRTQPPARIKKMLTMK